MKHWFRFKDYKPLNLIELNRDNLLFNYDFFKRETGLSVWPVLKGNAYGHGIKQVVEILENRDFEYFVVDGYHEVIEIRKVTNKPILMIGSMKPINFSNINWKNLSIMVQDGMTVKKLGNLNKVIKIHLKVNTGMNRQGVNLDEIDKIIKLINKYPKLVFEGVFSHLSGADEIDSESLTSQLKDFEKAIEVIEQNGIKVKFRHLSATAGALKVKSCKLNAIRLGIGLYGINNLDKHDKCFRKFDKLKPVLSFKSCLTTLRRVLPGERVSYNGTWVVKSLTDVGVIPVGYCEGLDRRLSNKGWVKYRNKFYPIIGRICMNLAMIDLGKTKARLFDELEIISSNKKDKNSISNMSACCKTIPYDLLVKINPSVRRVII